MTSFLKIAAVCLILLSLLLALKAVYSAATSPFGAPGWASLLVAIGAAGWAIKDALEAKESLGFPIAAVVIGIISLGVGATIEFGRVSYDNALEQTLTDADKNSDQMHATEKSLGIK